MENRERIIVLGGDGFCGWPTSLRLSSEGYDVVIVDNLSRRKIDVELGCESLTPIKPLEQRLRRWEEISGRRIDYRALNIADDYEALEQLIQEVRPKAIVHFAEQRAAPYSMKSPRHKRYTVDNNINGTHNILCAIVESGLDIHLVHLGTMGVYGYGTAGMSIPEGYLTVKVDIDGVDREIEIPYPPHPGSIYHMTKTLDALLFYYYNKNDDIRITDLHQGVVWGTNTEETLMHPDLINRFDWEGDYGTVLNRFLVEAAVGHPLTVYGSGGQTRAFIHIRDTVRCISLAIKHPPARKQRVKIFNQATETHRVRDLAGLVARLTGAEVRYYVNPRNEASENELVVHNEQFLELGLNPITLSEGLLQEVIEIASRYADRVDQAKIIADSRWRADIPLDREGTAARREPVAA
ncbi:MAG: NAD-dependent epimerase/dehydratase family protein [Caldilinea sp.]|nr:NAD-dependent epimerase/dehydratase family protein [Caldilineaceae bacterium]MCB9123859.1 NAD-dependent epimerase/dehydratase family protein [Caldilineaceae bacterium]MCO5212691.1 NAD-dependent epimerase/dehydratase family protein [Caldilinea sp.]MCW5841718.1 NAD-dependent epimerase/dehydratase family protein [Caldilinea sp.]HRW47715.1 NAD-dependent epimerase/dehydratase family protein [Caldilinea sp.]